MSRARLASSQALFTVALLIFFFTLLNGYLQNLVAGYRAEPWLVLAGLVVEMALTLLVARRLIQVELDLLEVAGFVIVVLATWIYFVAPALPTWLPPTQSSDAVRVYLQVLFAYPNGTLVSWYPAGGTFVVAMFSHWLGSEPLRLLHPVAASFIALSAGAVYGMTCTLLPKTRASKIAALLAPALLFVPWAYFAGTLDWEQYFFAQVFAQYFILAALWYSASYAEQTHWIFGALIGAALLGVVAAYPIFVALPFGLFGLVVLARFFPAGRVSRSTLITLGAFVVLMLLAAMALQRGGILDFSAGQKSVVLDVGQGGVTNPSLDNLGGPIFLALALGGVWFAWRAGVFGKTILGLLVVWIFQLVALLALQPSLQLSGYRVDKTFYILVFPLAMLAALPLAILFQRLDGSPRKLAVGFITTLVVLGSAVLAWRPPIAFAPLTESEIAMARWAKDFYMETTDIAYLDDTSISAYWLAFGLWREKIPDEWFQWIPAGRKMGPPTFDEWLQDPMWHSHLLVRYIDQVPPEHIRIVHQIGDSAIIDRDAPADPGLTPNDYGIKVPHRSDINFANTLTLIGYDLARTTFHPGETITLTTWTQSLYPPPATVAWRVELVDHTNQVVSRIERAPFNDKYPLQRWPPGKYTSDDWSLPLAQNLAPGVYDLRMALFRRSDGELIDARRIYALDPAAMPAAPITRIKLPLPPPSADELRDTKSIQAKFGDEIALANYQLQTDRAAHQIHLTLYWQGLKKPGKDYTAFVHLLDAAGQVVAQQDAEPLAGRYPTSIWDVGEIVKDEYALAIPPDARAPFTIEIGMYDQPAHTRLPVGNSDHLQFQIPDF